MTRTSSSSSSSSSSRAGKNDKAGKGTQRPRGGAGKGRTGPGKRGGARPGAGRRQKSESVCVEMVREKGMTMREVVHELHVQRGFSLLQISRILKLDMKEVEKHSEEARAALLEQAPKSEADFTALREQISLMLWRTVEATFEEGTRAAGGGQAAVAALAAGTVDVAIPKPPMISVRLRALKQLCELYGVGAEGREKPEEVKRAPYATPDEIVEWVRDWRVREGAGGSGGVYGG